MFGSLIVGYLFLGGTGAGACLVLSVIGLLVPRERVTAAAGQGRRGLSVRFQPSSPYRTLFVPSYGCVLVVLLIGVLCLVVDVGRADRLLLLVLSPTFSHIAVGAYAYAACFAFALMLALSWAGVIERAPMGLIRAVQVLSIPVALVAIVYTGLLLQSIGAVPLWSVFWLPVMFVLSSVSCGIVLVAGIAHFGEAGSTFASLFRGLIMCDAVFIVLEAGAVAAFLVVCGIAAGEPLSGTAEAAANSYTELIAGAHAGLWWVGFIGFGLAVPLVLEAAMLRMRQARRGLVLAVSACVLFGGLVMRFCIVEAGMHPALAFVVGG